jgi:hypothetical protein
MIVKSFNLLIINKMNIYGIASLMALEEIQNNNSPEESWDIAIEQLTKSDTSRKKGCPKAAFLGLCEDGYIQGVNNGEYTNSTNNKEYAIKAVEILRREPNNPYKNITLWNQVLGELQLEQKKHNGQMDVVLDLWNAGKITIII